MELCLPIENKVSFIVLINVTNSSYVITVLDSPVTDEYLFAHLSHENQTVVLEWVNTLLYIKYKLLKDQNPATSDKV